MIADATDGKHASSHRLVLVAERDARTRELEAHFLAASGVAHITNKKLIVG